MFSHTRKANTCYSFHPSLPLVCFFFFCVNVEIVIVGFLCLFCTWGPSSRLRSLYPYLFVRGGVQGRSLSFVSSAHKTHCHDWLATLQTHYQLADRAGRCVLLCCVDYCLPDISGSGNFKCGGAFPFAAPLSLTLKVTWIWISPPLPVRTYWWWSLRST